MLNNKNNKIMKTKILVLCYLIASIIIDCERFLVISSVLIGMGILILGEIKDSGFIFLIGLLTIVAPFFIVLHLIPEINGYLYNKLLNKHNFNGNIFY